MKARFWILSLLLAGTACTVETVPSTDDGGDAVGGDADLGDVVVLGDTNDGGGEEPDADPLVDLCEGVRCSGHGACRDGVCTCEPGFEGAACDSCEPAFGTYPNCACPPAEQPIPEGDGGHRCGPLPDIAFYDATTLRWTLFINQGDGSFDDGDSNWTLSESPAESDFYGVGLADFDGDGFDDIWSWVRTTADGRAFDVAWTAYRNPGDGTFADSTWFTSEFAGPGAVLGAVGDVDGDGLADLLSYNVVGDDWTFGINDGEDRFPRFTEDGGGRTGDLGEDLDDAIGTGDFDGDGFDDAAVALEGNLYLFLNTRDGRFSTAHLARLTQSGDFATGDFDANGYDDLVTYDPDSREIRVRYNRGRGEFDRATRVGIVPSGFTGTFVVGNLGAP